MLIPLYSFFTNHNLLMAGKTIAYVKRNQIGITSQMYLKKSLMSDTKNYINISDGNK
ncbi:hypothetical protein Fmac_023662 [Flemingia macrophylla]|uniref:Uncharacterized protein n=1 Tax=Flemingia macrophylla TaxID=520843 RepID=A0ABD1LM59_9FABA